MILFPTRSAVSRPKPRVFRSPAPAISFPTGQWFPAPNHITSGPPCWMTSLPVRSRDPSPPIRSHHPTTNQKPPIWLCERTILLAFVLALIEEKSTQLSFLYFSTRGGAEHFSNFCILMFQRYMTSHPVAKSAELVDQ